jgi:hypothetical protein
VPGYRRVGVGARLNLRGRVAPGYVRTRGVAREALWHRSTSLWSHARRSRRCAGQGRLERGAVAHRVHVANFNGSFVAAERADVMRDGGPLRRVTPSQRARSAIGREDRHKVAQDALVRRGVDPAGVPLTVTTPELQGLTPGTGCRPSNLFTSHADRRTDTKFTTGARDAAARGFASPTESTPNAGTEARLVNRWCGCGPWCQ